MKHSSEDIIKLLLGEFGDRDIEVSTVSDDGGPVAEIRVLGTESSKRMRRLIPLKYEGWRTVVIENQIPDSAS
jgi:hypothetical protein